MPDASTFPFFLIMLAPGLHAALLILGLRHPEESVGVLSAAGAMIRGAVCFVALILAAHGAVDPSAASAVSAGFACGHALMHFATSRPNA